MQKNNVISKDSTFLRFGRAERRMRDRGRVEGGETRRGNLPRAMTRRAGLLPRCCRYYFFQSLSVTGAMLLIASRGAGRFSVDGNKKFG